MKLLFSKKLKRDIRLLFVHHEKSPLSFEEGGNFGSPIKDASGGVLEVKLYFLLCSFHN